MASEKSVSQVKKKPLSEENLAYELSEDWRLVTVGINPDGNPVDIMVEADRLMQKHDREHSSGRIAGVEKEPFSDQKPISGP